MTLFPELPRAKHGLKADQMDITMPRSGTSAVVVREQIDVGVLQGRILVGRCAGLTRPRVIRVWGNRSGSSLSLAATAAAVVVVVTTVTQCQTERFKFGSLDATRAANRTTEIRSLSVTPSPQYSLFLTTLTSFNVQ